MIRIRNECAGYQPPLPLLNQVLDAALLSRGQNILPGRLTVDLVLMDDEAIRLLNLQFKKKECATDVLAWYDGSLDEEGDSSHLGDIAVSVTTAVREAALRGISPDHEVLLYSLHGLLHLLGGRDGTEDEQASMRQAERNELGRWGIIPHWEDMT